MKFGASEAFQRAMAGSSWDPGGVVFLDSGAAEASLPAGAAIPLTNVLASYCGIYGNKFQIDGQLIDAEIFFAPEIFLPAVVWEAQILGTRLLNADLGCRLRVEPESLLGVMASAPLITGNLADIMRALLCIHAAKMSFGSPSESIVEVSMVIDHYKKRFAGMLDLASSHEGELKWPHQM